MPGPRRGLDPAQRITDQRAVGGKRLAGLVQPLVDILKRATGFLRRRGRAGNGDAVAETVEGDIQRAFKLCQIGVVLAGQDRKLAIILELHADGGGFGILRR